MSLDTIFRERENLNIGIVESINKAAESWGITCLRYEIRNFQYIKDECLIKFLNSHCIIVYYYIGDIQLPSRVQEAMQLQVEAERRKRAQILESEGKRESNINVAEGDKRARILASGKVYLKLISDFK